MVILKEVKMFPRNSSEGQVSRMGGQVPWMGGQVHGDLGKQEQRQFGRGGADRRQKGPPGGGCKCPCHCRPLPWDRHGLGIPGFQGEGLAPLPPAFCAFAERGAGSGRLSWREPGPSGPAVPVPLPAPPPLPPQSQAPGSTVGLGAAEVGREWSFSFPEPQSIFLPFV